MKLNINDMLKDAKTVAIFGHVRPDGDCVGSTMGLYNYILDNYPRISADIYLERFSESFKFMRNVSDVKSSYTGGAYDAVFVLDSSSCDRVGANGLEAIKNASFSYNLDHHISNAGDICGYTDVQPDVSSASEVLYYLLDPSKVSKSCAECLYLGIVHDTGVFRFESTGKKTFEAAGALIDTGVDFARIINETYFNRTYNQTRVTGFVMERCELEMDGRLVWGYITEAEMKRYSVTALEMDGIIDAIREVNGTEVAVFMYPVNGRYKISARSNYVVDVSRVCKAFGGGGHIRAAGASAAGSPQQIIEQIIKEVEKQL